MSITANTNQRRPRWHLVIAFMVGFAFNTGVVAQADINSIQKKMVMLNVIINSKPYQLETQILTPPGAGTKPLAIINHGSPRKKSSRAQMTTHQYLWRAMEFARRGYITAIVMRRGYGRSQAKWFETFGKCEDPAYTRAAFTTANDIIAAMSALKKLRGVDQNGTLIVGQSAGGIGAVAVAAKNPKGVAATINFAGGRGSLSHGTVCKPSALISTYGVLGKTASIPSLWVYTENDGYFKPGLSRQFHRTFTRSGGKADFVLTSAFGKDGHKLFSKKGIARWRPLVDSFLRKNRLKTWQRSPPILVAPNIAPPAGLSMRGKRRWKSYLGAAPNKAFAKSRTRKKTGWRSSRNTLEEAKFGAMRNCRLNDCEVVSINGSPPK